MADTNKQPPIEQSIILRLNEVIENVGKIRDELQSVDSSGKSAQKSLDNVSKSMDNASKASKRLFTAVQTVGKILNTAFRGVAFAAGALEVAIKGPSDALLQFQASSAVGTKNVRNLIESYKDMTKASGDSLASLQSFAEVMTGFQRKGIAEAVAGGSVAFQKGVKGMQDVLMRSFSRDQAKSMLAEFFEGFGDQFATLQSTIGRIGETAANALAAGKPEDAVAEYEKAIEELGRAIAVSTGDPTPILNMIQAFKVARDEAAGAADGMVRPIRSLNELANRLSEAWRKAEAAILGAFGDDIANALGWVNTQFKVLEKRLRDWAEGGGIENIKKSFASAFSSISDGVQKIWGFIQPIFEKIGGLLESLVSGTFNWSKAIKIAGIGLGILYGPAVLKGLAGLAAGFVKARLECMAAQKCKEAGGLGRAYGAVRGWDADELKFRQWRAGEKGVGGLAGQMGMGRVGAGVMGAAAGVGGYFAGGAAGGALAGALGGGPEAKELASALGGIAGAAAAATATAGPLAGAIVAVGAGLVEIGKSVYKTVQTYKEANAAIAENEKRMAEVAAQAAARRDATYDPTRAAREGIQDELKSLEQQRAAKIAEQKDLLKADPLAAQQGKGYELEVAINNLTAAIAKTKEDALGGMATREVQFKETGGIDAGQYKILQDLEKQTATEREESEKRIAAIREQLAEIQPADTKSYNEINEKLKDALAEQKRSLAWLEKRKSAEHDVGRALAEQKVLMAQIKKAQEDLNTARSKGDATQEAKITASLEKMQKALQDQRDAEASARDAASKVTKDEGITDSLNELEQQFKQAKDEHDRFVEAGESGTAEYWKKVKELNKKFGELDTQIAKTGNQDVFKGQLDAIKGLQSEIGDVYQAYLAWFKSLKELQGYTNNLQRMSGVMDTLGSIISSMGPSMQILNQSADAMIGAMGTAILDRAFNTFMNAEKNMALAQTAVENANRQVELAAQKRDAARGTADEAKAQEEYNRALQEAGGASEKLNQSAAEYAKLMQSISKIPEQIVAREKELENMARLITGLHREDLNISKALYGTPALGVDAQLKIARSLEQQKVALTAAAEKQAQLLADTRAQIDAVSAAMEIASTEEERANLAKQLNLLKGQEWATQKQLVQTQTEAKRVTVEQLETVKQLRDGYLDAVQAQAFAAGRFEKIIITQEKNVSRAMEKGIAKRNFLLGQVGEDATAAAAQPYRFSAAGYGALEKPGGGAFTPEDMAARMDAALKNISDPVQRAAVQQSMMWLKSSQNLAQSYTEASNVQVDALQANTDALNQFARDMMERRPPPAEAGRGVWGEEAARQAGVVVPKGTGVLPGAPTGGPLAGVPGAAGAAGKTAVNVVALRKAIEQAASPYLLDATKKMAGGDEATPMAAAVIQKQLQLEMERQKAFAAMPGSVEPGVIIPPDSDVLKTQETLKQIWLEIERATGVKLSDVPAKADTTGPKPDITGTTIPRDILQARVKQAEQTLQKEFSSQFEQLVNNAASTRNDRVQIFQAMKANTVGVNVGQKELKRINEQAGKDRDKLNQFIEAFGADATGTLKGLVNEMEKLDDQMAGLGVEKLSDDKAVRDDANAKLKEAQSQYSKLQKQAADEMNKIAAEATKAPPEDVQELVKKAVEATNEQVKAVQNVVETGQNNAETVASDAQKAVDGMPELTAVDTRKGQVRVEREEIAEQKSGIKLDDQGMALPLVGEQTKEQARSAEDARKKNAKNYDKAQTGMRMTRDLAAADKAMKGARRAHDEAMSRMQLQWIKQGLDKRKAAGQISPEDYQKELERYGLAPQIKPQAHQVAAPAAIEDEKTSTLSHGKGARRRGGRGRASDTGTGELRDAAESLIAAANIIEPILDALITETPGINSRHAGQSGGGAVIPPAASGR